MAARDNKLSTIQWAKSNDAAFAGDTIRAAVRYGHKDVVEYLMAEHPACKAECYEYAMTYGQLSILRWLDEHYGYTRPTAMNMSMPATYGHLAVLQYVREQGFEWDDDSSEVVTQAALNEHHDIVKWLITEGCPYDAHELGIAVLSCYDDSDKSVNMIKWLSEHGVVWSEYTLTRMLDECGVNAQLIAAKYVRELGAHWPDEILVTNEEHGDEDERVTWHDNVREWAISAGCKAPIVDITSEYN
jgi:hypothetical protein